MKMIAGALALTMAASFAHAGSIQAVDATTKSFPSFQGIDGATVEAALPGEAEPEAAPTAQQMSGDPRKPVDGRTSLELWAKQNGTSVEAILSEKTNGFLQLKEKQGSSGKEVAAKPTNPMATDAEKTASVNPDAAEEPKQASAGGDEASPDGKVRAVE